MTAREVRQGPRPLGLHLMAAQAAWMTAFAALPSSSAGWPGWKTPPLPGDLVGALENHDPEALKTAVGAEILNRFDRFLTGLERYRHHIYRRSLPDPPILWREGATRLLDYGGVGAPVLVVPSLVNRCYVLDLTEQRSLMRWLAGRGVRPLLVDWGRPDADERRFTLTDYIAGRLEKLLDAAVAAAGAPVPVVGYCMGGLLAVALAQRRRRDVSSLALLATPWDFHAAGAAQVRQLAALLATFGPAIELWQELPVDAIQALFGALDPLQAARKFIAFSALDPASERAAAFVALEDWLNDGVPLAAAVARECIAGWYGDNTPARGQWRVAGWPVDPAVLDLPSLHIIPDRDRIVPPASALALATAMAGAKTLRPTLGHIGMVVGGRAPDQVWRPLADWLTGP
ncbi:MAG: alpha/beta fold hydrolase [Inquilinaceae bacterium]